MSGLIVFGDGRHWQAQSNLFNWVNEFLIGKLVPGPDRDELLLIDEQNFRFLDCSQLTDAGARRVIDVLRNGLESYARANYPDIPERRQSLDVISKLVELARE